MLPFDLNCYFCCFSFSKLCLHLPLVSMSILWNLNSFVTIGFIFPFLWFFFKFRAKLVDIALASGKIDQGEGFKYIKESFKTGTLGY